MKNLRKSFKKNSKLVKQFKTNHWARHLLFIRRDVSYSRIKSQSFKLDV